VLCNLKEAYVKLKENALPDIVISFLEFSELRPKWCVLSGAYGAHTPQDTKIVMQVIDKCS
jgi:hypothetical protein